MIPTNVNNLVEVTLADGSTRHLRYTLGARKRIEEKLGKEPKDIMGTAPEILVPIILMEGLVEREGLTEESIMETLVTSNMTDYIAGQFIESFFVPRVAQFWSGVMSRLEQNNAKALAVALAAMDEKMTPKPAETVQ